MRERNLPAQMFFRGHGFQATKLLRNYYEDSGEDAYQMELRAPAYDPFDEFGGRPGEPDRAVRGELGTGVRRSGVRSQRKTNRHGWLVADCRTPDSVP